MPWTLPYTLPAAPSAPGEGGDADDTINDGGYDFKIGGIGFRLATDQQNPYTRVSEQTTVRRYDNSKEPGEQSLAQLPWIKAQSTFHGGAGQLNLEQALTDFQYQQEQVEHVRFDTCLGVDVWTLGQVKRLPTTLVTALGGRSAATAITASVGGVDYAVVGGTHSLFRLAWNSGPDAAPTLTDIDLTGATFGGSANCTVTSICTDGATYYALIQLASAGSIASVKTLIVKGSVSSAAAPTVVYKGPTDSAQHPGALGWVKARLVAGLDAKFYTLDVAAAAVDWTTLTPNYVHPSASVVWGSFAESPSAVLASIVVGAQSSILEFTLDDTGTVPTLGGGAVLAVLPPGELITAMGTMLGSFMGIGTTAGLRVGQFDSFTGNLTYGPISVATTAPVLSMTGRDRFIYAGYTNQQEDGKTGLLRLDLSFTVDAAGRLAWAPDLRPPSTAATGVGSVVSVGLLPTAQRVIFFAPDGVHVEGNGPSADGEAWIRTSRIRYDTTENKLFKLGRITGTLDSASIKITGITPFGGASNLGTLGFIADGNPGEFALPGDLHEWLQLQFDLNGADCVLSTYQAKAYPAPAKQYIITLTANCFAQESDRGGYDVSDPIPPRDRYQQVRDLEIAGNEVRFVEFTNTGPVVERVLIDQLAFVNTNRPSDEDDFGGIFTLRLRTTQA